MKSCSAFFVLLWVTAAAGQPAAPAGTSIVAKSTYHKDNSHSETILDKSTNELIEATYNAAGVLVAKKHYLLNERGLPTQGHIYDGRGNLVARSQVYFDAYGRAAEMRSFNLNGQCYQQVIYEYDQATGAAKKPKVINVDPRAAPSIKPAYIDFTQNTTVPGMVTPQQQQGAVVPQQQAVPAQPQAPPKKKGFFGRLFGK
ncbi:hypothetical protein [Prosthecobacter sp.]|uniref:hypothetical protein n=1 Tax=Prosthecobacter sp. TaxID=1965333 RepID=UPI003784E156